MIMTTTHHDMCQRWCLLLSNLRSVLFCSVLQVTLQLSLRLVADIGLVGLPNAGKSSLLKAITRASPEIANYPFTTLTPNLGVAERLGRAKVADLPGLIAGAHTGKGLGRIFLRHLRRAKIILHIVDASAENPVEDFRTILEELRMFNPAYLSKPHIGTSLVG
jgi:Obg family GTPase CgtA